MKISKSIYLSLFMLLLSFSISSYAENTSDNIKTKQTSAIKSLKVVRKMKTFEELNGVKPFGYYWNTKKNDINAEFLREPGLIYTLTIGDNTAFTKRLPSDYDQKKLIEWGKYPGLNMDILHKHGFTGKGAVIAYVDAPLGINRPDFKEEYVGNLIHYVNNTDVERKMHGLAVLSLLLGKKIGTAPEVELYYYAIATWELDQQRHSEALYQIIEKNKILEDNKKIRMVGFSDCIDESEKNTTAFRKAVKACEDAGIMVWFCDEYGSVSFIPYSDKNSFESLVPEYWWGNKKPGLVCVPCAGRTTSSVLDELHYIYWAKGGLSWAMPYVLGLYAIAIEIDPSLTQDALRKLIVDTAYINSEGMLIVNPVGFVAEVLKKVGRDSEAQAMLDEVKARTKYIYAVINEKNLHKGDLITIEDHLVSITDASVLTVDATKFDYSKNILDAIQRDSENRGGIVAGIQLFGVIYFPSKSQMSEWGFQWPVESFRVNSLLVPSAGKGVKMLFLKKDNNYSEDKINIEPNSVVKSLCKSKSSLKGLNKSKNKINKTKTKKCITKSNKTNNNKNSK